MGRVIILIVTSSPHNLSFLSVYYSCCWHYWTSIHIPTSLQAAEIISALRCRISSNHCCHKVETFQCMLMMGCAEDWAGVAESHGIMNVKVQSQQPEEVTPLHKNCVVWWSPDSGLVATQEDEVGHQCGRAERSQTKRLKTQTEGYFMTPAFGMFTELELSVIGQVFLFVCQGRLKLFANIYSLKP